MYNSICSQFHTAANQNLLSNMCVIGLRVRVNRNGFFSGYKWCSLHLHAMRINSQYWSSSIDVCIRIWKDIYESLSTDDCTSLSNHAICDLCATAITAYIYAQRCGAKVREVVLLVILILAVAILAFHSCAYTLLRAHMMPNTWCFLAGVFVLVSAGCFWRFLQFLLISTITTLSGILQLLSYAAFTLQLASYAFQSAL